MKITRHDQERLELAGIPGGATAIVVPLGMATVGGLSLAFGLVAGVTVPIVVGGVMVLAGAGVLLHSITMRERLSLDLRLRCGTHRVYSVLSRRGSLIEFPFEQIAGVEFSRGRVRTPGNRSGPGTETWTARLRLVKLPRAIVLAETQGGREQTVRPLAEQVARALGVDLIDQTADLAERSRGAAIGAPVAAQSLADTSFGAAPEGSRARLSVLPADERVELVWKTLGGPALPVLGLAAVGFFALLATVMSLQATGLAPVLSWMFGSASRAPKPAPPGISAALVSMAAALWLLWTLILQTWRWSWRRLVVTSESVTLVAASPLAAAGSVIAGPAWATRWSVPTHQVQSVRTHDDAVELRDPNQTRRAMVHLPAEGEVVWMAKVIRTAVKVLGQGSQEELMPHGNDRP